MAKLFLRFEQSLIRVFPLPEGEVTIGRLPDNVIAIDNPAVSGHHARICWETGHYVLEDCNSRNGTFVNGKLVSRVVLQDEDEILICKHTLVFKDEKDKLLARPAQQAAPAAAPVPHLDATMMLDTRKVKDILAHSTGPGATGSAAPAPTPAGAEASPVPSLKERVGMLTVVSGSTDQPQYVLAASMNAIGKSDMASIKLKGWFKPKLAAVISRRDQGYYIAASVSSVQIKVNQQFISGARELKDGDRIEVCGVRMTFSYK